MATAGDGRAKRRWGISQPWQQYVISLIFLTVAPLLPLGLEAWVTNPHVVREQTITLTAVIYLIAVATSSRSPLQVFSCLVGAIFFGFLFGEASSVEPSRAHWTASSVSAVIGIVFFSVPQLLERYNRHVSEGISFFEFPKDRP